MEIKHYPLLYQEGRIKDVRESTAPSVSYEEAQRILTKALVDGLASREELLIGTFVYVPADELPGCFEDSFFVPARFFSVSGKRMNLDPIPSFLG